MRVHERDKIVENPYYIDNIIERVVDVPRDKIIEVPVDKIIQKHIERLVEKPVYYDNIIER